jgi:hypothetical protein
MEHDLENAANLNFIQSTIEQKQLLQNNFFDHLNISGVLAIFCAYRG